MKRLLLSIILISGTHVYAAATGRPEQEEAARPKKTVGQMRTDAEHKVNSDVGCKLVALKGQLKWEFIKEQDTAMRSSLLAAIKSTEDPNKFSLIEAKADAVHTYLQTIVRKRYLELQEEVAADVQDILAARDSKKLEKTLAGIKWDTEL